jgi:3-oxoadipate enol-lactonase
VSRTRYALNGELRIAYELRGTMHRRRPWLVLIQGMGFDRAGWEPVQRKLRRHFRLVLADNRGFGLSDRPAGLFGVAAMAGDIVAVLDAAGIRRAHVMGASLGGMVAQELAITHAEQVDGLVLACTAPGWPFAYPMPQAAVRLILVTAVIRAEVARRRHTENALSARTVQHHPELVDRLLELQDSQPADPRALAAQAAAGALYAGRLRQARIRARTLVLHGGADTVVDPRNGKLLADRIPDARLVTFPELGHLLFWEDPDGFTDAVTSFLLAGGGGQQVPARRRARRGAWRRTGTRAAVSGTGPASANRTSPKEAASRP